MLPEDTEDKVISLAIDVKCKINKGAGVNVIPISTFRKLCPAVFDSTGKPLEKFNEDWKTNSLWWWHYQAICCKDI